MEPPRRHLRAVAPYEPPAAHRLIERPRLKRRLDAGFAFDMRVMVLCAPSGCGKSVALRQWMAEQPDPKALCDVAKLEERTDIGLILGIAEALDALGEQRSWPYSSEILFDILVRLKNFTGIIAIDSLEQMELVDEHTREFLEVMIAVSSCKWAFSLRDDERLRPMYTRWLAYGISDLAVDEIDLQFSPEEAAEFFARADVALPNHLVASKDGHDLRTPASLVAAIQAVASIGRQPDVLQTNDDGRAT